MKFYCKLTYRSCKVCIYHEPLNSFVGFDDKFSCSRAFWTFKKLLILVYDRRFYKIFTYFMIWSSQSPSSSWSRKESWDGNYHDLRLSRGCSVTFFENIFKFNLSINKHRQLQARHEVSIRKNVRQMIEKLPWNETNYRIKFPISNIFWSFLWCFFV